MLLRFVYSQGPDSGTQKGLATVGAEYQLVLQFQGDSLADYDAMIELEDRLIEALGDSAMVDGHDTGMGTVNIFIITPDPRSTFELSKPVIIGQPAFATMRAAYREADSDAFTMLWPDGAKAEDLVGL